MPSYKVINTGFYDKKLYSPDGKRNILVTDKPFKKIPSWLEPLKGETASQVKARKEAEAKQAEANKKEVEESKKEIEKVNFGPATQTL